MLTVQFAPSKKISRRRFWKKHVAPLGMYTYHLNKLAQKFAEIRRQDMANAQRKLAQSRDCIAHIENQKMVLEQKSQEEVNELFSAAIGSTGAPKKTSTKPDYSKYRIVKRSKSSKSSTPTSSSSSSSSSSPTYSTLFILFHDF
ncbi:hypothetical protein L3Y34_001175 [Caenorhabditis briggsae]|uniref:Uncharacterized protein n=2 Tax=Caenorhabditis briggsae TaxID=6238 RepID=A0AAE9IP14_CAEBR|nr:hypothetical protein L3Y34_001175 [Caenorhabditis briggsae]